MNFILYPTRGGDRTYRNQDQVQALAQGRGEGLLLLYVANVHFLDNIAGPVQVELLEKDLEEMGAFLLALAQEHAEKSGLEVQSIVRHGEFHQSVVDAIEENPVTAVVLGRPATGDAHTTIDFISKLAQSLATDPGIETFVVHDGEIVEHYQARPIEKAGDEV